MSHSYYRTYRKDFGGKFQVHIYQCEDERAPERKTKSVTKMCTIDCKLDVPFSSLPTIKNSSGERLKKMDFEVQMVPSGASVEFTVYIDGRRQGAQNAAVKFL